MRWVVVTGFVVFTLVKIKVLGIHGAGALTVSQMFATYGFDRWNTARRIKKDPWQVYIDDDNVVRWYQTERREERRDDRNPTTSREEDSREEDRSAPHFISERRTVRF